MRAGWEVRTLGLGRHRTLDDNGERLLNLRATNELKAGSSLFRHKNVLKWTWRILPREKNYDK